MPFSGLDHPLPDDWVQLRNRIHKCVRTRRNNADWINELQAYGTELEEKCSQLLTSSFTWPFLHGDDFAMPLIIVFKLSQIALYQHVWSQYLSLCSCTKHESYRCKLYQVLDKIVSYPRDRGPRDYFEFENAPLVAEIAGSVGTRGYSLHLWVYISSSPDQIPSFSLFRFITQEGKAGIDIGMHREHLAIRNVEQNSNWLSAQSKESKLTHEKWHCITLVHASQPFGNDGKVYFYLDGNYLESLSLNYPKACLHKVLQITIGAFCGKLANLVFFSDTLTPRQVQLLYVASSSSAELASFHAQLAGSVLTCPSRLDLSTNSRASSSLNRMVFALSARTLTPHSKQLDPPNWKAPKGISGVLNSITLLPGASVYHEPRHDFSFGLMGGFDYLFLFLSPIHTQIPYASEEEVFLIFHMLTSFVKVGLEYFERALAQGGLSGIRKFLFDPIPPSFRTGKVAAQLRRFLTAIDHIDTSLKKDYVLQCFSLFLVDMAYWREATLEAQREILKLTRLMISRTPELFVSSSLVTLSDLLGQVQCARPADFSTVSPPLATSNEMALIALRDLLACIGVFLKTKKPSLEQIQQLLELEATCTNDQVKGEIVEMLVDFVYTKPVSFWCYFMTPSSTSASLLDWRRFVKGLHTSYEPLRLSYLRLLGYYLNSLPTPEVRIRISHDIHAMLDADPSPALQTYPVTNQVYHLLLEMMIGQVSRPSHDDTTSVLNVGLGDEIVVKYPIFFQTIVQLIGAAQEDVREQILLDVLTLLKSNSENQRLLARQPFWQRWLLPLLALDPQTTSVSHQLVAQIFCTSLWYSLNQETKGWVSVDQTIWCVEEYAQRSQITPLTTHRFQIILFGELINRLDRGIDESLINPQLLTTNLRPTFQLLEYTLFETPQCFLINQRRTQGIDEIELTLYERFFRTALRLLALPERRQHVLRLLLRYLEGILPHPSCTPLCEAILEATRYTLRDRLDGEKHRNYRVVRLSLTYLKTSMESFQRRKLEEQAKHVKETITCLVDYWGVDLFQDETVTRLPSNEDELIILLMKHEIDSQGVLQQHRARFCQVLDTRRVKMHAMLQEFQRRRSMVTARRTEKIVQELEQVDSRRSVSPGSPARSRTFTFSAKHPLTNPTLQMLRNDLPRVRRRLKTSKRQLIVRYQLEGEEWRYDLSRAGQWYEAHPPTSPRLYWKLDTTETSLRQRVMLRYNERGTSHLQAANKSKVRVEREKVDLTRVAPTALRRASQQEETEENQTDSEQEQQEENRHSLFNEDEEEYEMISELEVEAKPSSSSDPSVSVRFHDQCTLITPTLKYQGYLTITSTTIEYNADREALLPGDQVTKAAGGVVSTPGLGTPSMSAMSHISSIRKNFSISLRQLRQVLPRRHLLRDLALELFVRTFKSYFFAFPSRSLRNQAYLILCRALHIPYELSNRRRLHFSGITEKWQKRQISNYEYLMHLNTISGRSFNDITQYPVMPWIVSDYHSSSLDLDQPQTYRDLSKPMGALTPARLVKFQEKYQDTMADGMLPPFHYGSHYSSAGIVLHYLLRVEPFTTQAILLQNGKFDLADRLFHSVESAWTLSTENVADVKELTPEWFNLPEMFRNENSLPLGIKQDGRHVDDVELPPWANGSPETFIRLHRQALESEYVSSNLHHWIDLIWGYKQQGQAAVEANNVFFYLTYAGSVDIDAIEDETLRDATLAQCRHFGQTPDCLFDQPHGKRDSLEECNLVQLCLPSLQITHPLIVESLPVHPPHSLQILRAREHQIAHVYLTSKGVFYKTYNLTHHSPTTPVLLIDQHAAHQITCAVLTKHFRFLFVGGFSQGALKVYDTSSGRCLSSVVAANGYRLTCCELDEQSGAVLVTGSLDGCVCMWNIYARRQSWARPPLLKGTDHVYCEHKSAVQGVDINMKLGVATSWASGDSRCVLYSVRRRALLRIIPIETEFEIEQIKLLDCARVVLLKVRRETRDYQLDVFTLNGRHIKHTVLRTLGQRPFLGQSYTKDYIYCTELVDNTPIVAFRESDTLQVVESFVGVQTLASVVSPSEEKETAQPLTGSSELATITSVTIQLKEQYLALTTSLNQIVVIKLPNLYKGASPYDQLQTTLERMRDSFETNAETAYSQAKEALYDAMEPSSAVGGLGRARQRVADAFSSVGTFGKQLFTRKK